VALSVSPEPQCAAPGPRSKGAARHPRARRAAPSTSLLGSERPGGVTRGAGVPRPRPVSSGRSDPAGHPRGWRAAPSTRLLGSTRPGGSLARPALSTPDPAPRIKATQRVARTPWALAPSAATRASRRRAGRRCQLRGPEGSICCTPGGSGRRPRGSTAIARTGPPALTPPVTAPATGPRWHPATRPPRCAHPPAPTLPNTPRPLFAPRLHLVAVPCDELTGASCSLGGQVTEMATLGCTGRPAHSRELASRRAPAWRAQPSAGTWAHVVRGTSLGDGARVTAGAGRPGRGREARPARWRVWSAAVQVSPAGAGVGEAGAGLGAPGRARPGRA
jgi:hypothetical protein